MVPRVTVLAIAACSGAPHRAAPAADPDRVAIVASENGPHGTRLVAIDEHGDRQFELIAPATTEVRDLAPAISPDGKWLVFASTRERAGAQTSLWIAPLGVEAAPHRLTTGDAIDANPVWTRDGRAIVFASTRRAGDYDLWQLPIDGGRASGEPIALTRAPTHEVTPTIAPDGAILYAAVTPLAGRATASRLEERTPDGAIRRLTAGPSDRAPACSPDGATVLFSRDRELWRMPHRDPAAAAAVIALPLTEESEPSWSRDGRYAFATSIYHGADGRALFSSVIHVDLTEAPVRARILRDRAGPLVRLTPAIATAALDAPALRGDPEYLPELANIMAAAIAEARDRQ